MKKIVTFVAVLSVVFSGFAYSVKKDIIKPADVNLSEIKNLGMMVESNSSSSNDGEVSFSLPFLKLQLSGKNSKVYSPEDAIGEDFLSALYENVVKQNYFDCYDSYFTKKKITDGESMPSTAFVVFSINRFSSRVTTSKEKDELVWTKNFDLTYTVRIFDGETRKMYFSDRGTISDSEKSYTGEDSFSDVPKFFKYKLESVASDLSKKIHPSKDRESMKLLQEKKVSEYKSAEKLLKKNDIEGAKEIYSQLAEDGSFEAAYNLVVLETLETTFGNGADLMEKLASESGDKRAVKEAANLKKIAEMEKISAERSEKREAILK